jgi:hypothetical protein
LLQQELVHRATKVGKVNGILDLFAVDGWLATAAAKAGLPYVGFSSSYLLFAQAQ